MRLRRSGFLMLVLAVSAVAQVEPEIDKDSISAHLVRRGNFPIRLMPSGEVVSLTPPEVMVMVPGGTQPSPQEGQRAAVLVGPFTRVMGSVLDIDRATRLDSWILKIRLGEPFPVEIAVGSKVGTLIEVGELKDAVYLEKPGNARANSEMPLFVIQPGGEARRATVRFGRESGALIQVLSGLSAGDRVIVTDTSKWNGYERVRLK